MLLESLIELSPAYHCCVAVANLMHEIWMEHKRDPWYLEGSQHVQSLNDEMKRLMQTLTLGELFLLKQTEQKLLKMREEAEVEFKATRIRKIRNFITVEIT